MDWIQAYQEWMDVPVKAWLGVADQVEKVVLTTGSKHIAAPVDVLISRRGGNITLDQLQKLIQGVNREYGRTPQSPKTRQLG